MRLCTEANKGLKPSLKRYEGMTGSILGKSRYRTHSSKARSDGSIMMCVMHDMDHDDSQLL